MYSELSVVLIYDKDFRGYVTDVPQLPGCMSQGKTREEAYKNIQEAIELYIDALTSEERRTLLDSKPSGVVE